MIYSIIPAMFFIGALTTNIAALVAKFCKHNLQLFDTLANVNLGIWAAFLLFLFVAFGPEPDIFYLIGFIAVVGGILSLIFSFKLGMIYTSLTICGLVILFFIILSQAHFGGH